MAIAIFPALMGIPHATLLYFFSSSAFVKIVQLPYRVLHSPTPEDPSYRSMKNQPVSKPGRPKDTASKHVRAAQVSVKTLSKHSKSSGPVDVNKLVDLAIVEYARHNRGVCPSCMRLWRLDAYQQCRTCSLCPRKFEASARAVSTPSQIDVCNGSSSEGPTAVERCFGHVLK